MKSKLLKFAIYGLASMSMLGCGDDHDEPTPVPNPPGVTETVYTQSFSRGAAWSATSYRDVTLVEIHSSISDLSLSSTPPSGYTLYLKKMPQKDGAGYNVYYLKCDMDAISSTTSNNGNSMVELEYYLSGSYLSNGKPKTIEYNKLSITIQRYLAPDEEAAITALGAFWYLEEEEESTNSNWVTYQSENSYTEYGAISANYELSSSPLKKIWTVLELTIKDENGNDIKKYQNEPAWSCNQDLPGWIYSNASRYNSYLVDTRFSFKNYPDDFGSSVFFVSDDVMLTMKASYSETGELEKVYRYKFKKYIPEYPSYPA